MKQCTFQVEHILGQNMLYTTTSYNSYTFALWLTSLQLFFLLFDFPNIRL